MNQRSTFAESLPSHALLERYMGRGGQFVLASKSEHEVVLVALGSHGELVLTHEEFTSEFFPVFFDDMFYEYGSKEAKMAENKDREAYAAAVQYCAARSTTTLSVNAGELFDRADDYTRDRAAGMKTAQGKAVQVVTTSGSQQTIDHQLEIDPDQLDEIFSGAKTHEVRVFDREFKVDNILKLTAFNRATNQPEARYAIVRVTNITPPGSQGLPNNIGVMSIDQIDGVDCSVGGVETWHAERSHVEVGGLINALKNTGHVVINFDCPNDVLIPKTKES